LQIAGCDSLENLDGLSGISMVGTTLYLCRNASLTEIDGLGAITAVGGSVSIQNHPQLQNLDGLANVETIGSEVRAGGNSALPDCEVCELLDQLTTEPTAIDVSDNLDDACTPVPDNCP
jgi:hypothetical protein